MSADVNARMARNGAVAERMISAYVHRAGSEDPQLIVGEFVESHEGMQEALDGLAELVLTLAERAADLSTPVNIWDPKRRVDPVKAMRLAGMATATFQDLGRELNIGGKHE